MGLFTRQPDPTLTLLLQQVTQATADSKSNSQRQDRHEDECSERYSGLTAAIEKLNSRMLQLILSVAGSIIIALVIMLYNILHAEGKL